MRYVSSAYLRVTLELLRGFRSEAVTTYETGPRAEPWTILAVIESTSENWMPNCVQCERLWKNDSSQLSDRIKLHTKFEVCSSDHPLRRYGHSRILGHMEPHFGGMGGRRLGDRRWHHSKDRWWFPIRSPL